MNKKEILASKVVKDYLDTVEDDGTNEQYQVALVDFFRWIDKHPDEYVCDPRRLRIKNPVLDLDYIDGVEKDLNAFIQSFKTRISEHIGRLYAPNTVSKRIYTFKSFLEWNHVELSKRFWMVFRKKHGSPNVVIEDINPTQEQVQKIFQMGNIREKAMISCHVSSGCRIGELCDVRNKDLHWDDFERYGVLLVTIRANNKGNKTNKERQTFFSSEAVHFLKLWLDSEREKHSKVSREKIKNLPKEKTGVIKDDDRVFPFTSATSYQRG